MEESKVYEIKLKGKKVVYRDFEGNLHDTVVMLEGRQTKESVSQFIEDCSEVLSIKSGKVIALIPHEVAVQYV